MDPARQEELVDSYGGAADLLQTTRHNIARLLHDASGLLDEPTGHIKDQLADLQSKLQLDRSDVQRRADFLIEADRALAHKLASTAGTLVNPYLADLAIEHGWTYREAELQAELDALRRGSAEQQVRYANRIREIEGHLRLLEHSTERARPDAGGTYTTERRAKFTSPSGISASAGMQAIVEALDHTADPSRVADDEFEIVHLDSGKILIVLPGVTDLSKTVGAVGKLALTAGPNATTLTETGPEAIWAIGWDPEHHSARDTWIAARQSTASAAVDDNRYAQIVASYVEQAVARTEIEAGSEVMIVGHSYGADTAVDLAADPSFNGELVTVTHVFAAAYHNEPQFDSVPSTTKVAVTQNIKDVVVVAESMLDGDYRVTQNQAKASVGRMVFNGGISGVNLVTEGLFELGEMTAEVATNTAREVTHSTSTERHAAIDYADFEFDAPDLPKVKPVGGVAQVRDNIVLAEFDGGFEGIGHHQNNYTEHLRSTTDPLLLTFFDDVATSGYTGDGLAWAVDVSVPEEMR